MRIRIDTKDNGALSLKVSSCAHRDKYKAIRTGDRFLPLDHQSTIVDYIDEITGLVQTEANAVDGRVVRDVCILIISFQYGIRVGQIARIETADLRIFETGAVHLSVLVTKQRKTTTRVWVTRRIEREWAVLFIELKRRRERPDGSPTNEKAPERLLFKV